jgi:hypothetical protein
MIVIGLSTTIIVKRWKKIHVEIKNGEMLKNVNANVNANANVNVKKNVLVKKKWNGNAERMKNVIIGK